MGDRVRQRHLSVAHHRVGDVVGMVFVICHPGIGCSERFFTAPLVVESRIGYACSSEVAVHEYGTSGIGLRRSRRIIRRHPDMPRPDAVVIAVEQSDQGIARLCSGSEADLPVPVLRRGDDCTPDTPGIGAAFPQHLGTRAVERARRDARRHAAVAHRPGVEAVRRAGLRGDIAVGRTRSREVLHPQVVRDDVTVFGRRERIGGLCREPCGCLAVPAVIETLEEKVVTNRNRAAAAVGHDEGLDILDAVTSVGYEADLLYAARTDINLAGITLELGVDAGAEPSRDISIGLSFGEQPCKLIVCIPPGKAIPRGRRSRQGAARRGAHDPKILRRADLLRGQSPSGRYAALPVFDIAVFYIGFHLVGVAVGEVIALPVTIFVPYGHGITQQVVVLRYDLREIGHLVRALALELPDLEIEIAARTDAVKLHARGIAFGNLHLSRQRDLILVSLDSDVKRPLRVYGAVTAAGVLLQIVPHRERIAAHARIDFVVAQNGYVERMVRIAPDVEIRGVVLAQIDPISQHLLAAHGTDHKIGGIRRSVVAVLVPLRGDACDCSLQVFGKIRRTRIAGSRREGNIGIIARAVVGGCGRGRAISEKGAAARDVAEAHRH